MSEKSEVQRRFVRVEEGGAVREFDFAPFPTGAEQGPPGGIQMVIVPLSEIIGDGPGELRHLSYDDPPHNMSELEWRETLQDGARAAVNEEHFVHSLIHALMKDLVLSHGCTPDVAGPAIMEFGKKVYAEVTGTV